MTGIVSEFHDLVNPRLKEWQDRLARHPAKFSEIEQEAMATGQEVAGWLITACLAAKSTTESVHNEAQQLLRTSPRPLRSVGPRSFKLRLLCGLVLRLACCSYFVPRLSAKQRGAQRGQGRRGKEGTGIYLEPAALGIIEGSSPLVVSEVSRACVLLPSIEVTRTELKQRGMVLDEKTIHSILRVTAELALAARRDDLVRWRNGELQPTNDLDGKRVVASIDGGKTRTRELKKGKRTKKGRRRFATPWREPKLMTIYVIDENGKRDKTFNPVIDGTFLGADHIFELVAFHLFRLGAAQSNIVLFVADGADWIWDRVGMAAHQAGLQRKQWRACADLYHVMEQMNKALKAVSKWDDATRKRERKKIKDWLLDERVDEIIAYLKRTMTKKTKKVFQGRIDYLRRRRGLLAYRRLRRAKLPIGSGAVESAIRRVINLRLKCPSAFWYIENAEGVLYLRAQALTGRWDDLMKTLHKRGTQTRSRDWKWEPTPMSCIAPENEELSKEHKLTTLKR